MSYRHNNTATATTTHATRPAPAGQRSYIVSIDTGSFTNVEIVVGDYHHRTGVWTSHSRADTVKVTNKSHVYTYEPTTPSTKRTPFTPLQPQSPTSTAFASVRSQSSSASASAPDARNKRTYERDRARDYTPARQHRLDEERARAHLQRQREREEEARRLSEAEARRAAAAAKEARRRQRLAEQLRHEEQKRLQQQRAERRRSERTRRAREIASAWSSHETRWSGLLSQSHNQNGASPPLTFERIPWPVADVVVVEPPPAPQDGRRTRTRTRRAAALDELLRPEAIREFLLSPAHSPEVSSKDRIRAALRRWHPDKFARVLGLVVESDKDAVAEGVGIVVRCLNEMLERENHA